MTIISSAYQSSACKDYVMRRIEEDVKACLVTGRLIALREGIWALPPADYDAGVGTIGVFNYPLVFDHQNEKHVVVDGRTLLQLEPNGNLRARRYDEFTAKVIFAQIVKEWAEGEANRLLSFSALPLAIFANWLAEVIAKRFALNMMAQMQVGILAAIYYHNLFGDGEVITSRNGAETIVAISRACGYKPGDVSPVVEAYPVIDSLEAFCEACRNHTQDVHLRDLNLVTLQGVVGGYWYGNAGRESIAVALEYPPMWFTLLFQAITDRSFKKSGLTTVVERNSWKKHHESFVRALMNRAELSASSAIRV